MVYRFIFSLLLLLVCACNKAEVASNLSQHDAHKIVSELSEQGINASFSKDRTQGFSIYVSESDRLLAISTISNNQLIAGQSSEFNELTKAKGFIPNSRELDNLRLDRALAIEIEEALISNPLIDEVNVIVRSNYKKDSTAVSAIINTNSRDSFNITEIEDIIISSVPGINRNEIQLVLHDSTISKTNGEIVGVSQNDGSPVAVPLVPFLMWKVPAGVEKELGLGVILFLMVFLAFGLAIGYLLTKKKPNKMVLPEPLGETKLRIDEKTEQ